MAKSKEKLKAQKMMDVLRKAPLYDWEKTLSEMARNGNVNGIMDLIVKCIAKASREEGKARQLRNQLEKKKEETFETLLPELWKIFLKK